MVVGRRIRQLRRSNGMSQYELGQKLGVSKVSVSGYENGARVPSLKVLENLVEVFSVSADYLLGRELDAVHESDESIHFLLSSIDIDIINEIKKNKILYNNISENPKRFFANMNKKNI